MEKEKKKDAAMKKELAGAKILERMESMADRIKPPRQGEDMEKWQKKNAGPLRQILGLYMGLEKKYGDTKVFVRAKAFAKSMRLIE